MTEVNGLRLAYRGFVAGLAGAWMWVGIAMTLGALLAGDALDPLRPFALAVSPVAGSTELAFVIGLLAVQAGGGLVGLCFAYFFGRFFTVAATLRIAAPLVALLAWALIGAGLEHVPGAASSTPIVGLVATLAYGLLLGARVPVRGEVTRYAGSPST